jgi:putative sigma-54 modulation protein
MKLEFSGKNLTVSGALKEKVEKKLQKLEKFTGKMVSARITLEVEKHKNLVELVVHCSHDKIYKAKGEEVDMYLAINHAADALEQQAKKTKGKILAVRSKGKASSPRTAPVEEEPLEEIRPEVVARFKRRKDFYSERPMSIEDALLYLEEKKMPLVVFREIKNGQICVVYKEGPMNYALVETGKG